MQLAKRRGALVTAVCAGAKAVDVRAQGADHVIERDHVHDAVAAHSIDVVLDLVGGPRWPSLINALRVGGRYAVAGAIAGPLVELDLRTVYLKDLTMFGCTFQPDEVFENLIGYVQRNEIRPVVARTYPLEAITQAQTDFLSKSHTGKLVLIPPRP